MPHLHDMAASRDQDDARSPRPSRIHRIPGHLVDYELSYHTRGPRLSPNLTEEVMMAPSDSHYTRRPDVEEIRWWRMEDCLINIQHQMWSLQVTVAESRDLNKRVQQLEQLTSPVPKGTLMEVEPNHLLWPIQVQRLLRCRRKENVSSLTTLSVKGQRITGLDVMSSHYRQSTFLNQGRSAYR